MKSNDWPDTASCLVDQPGTTRPVHPMIAELQQTVAADYKLVASRGLAKRRSLDGVIVLIGEQDHDKPGPATRALESIWQRGDLHFVELPDPYVRSGQLNGFLRGIPATQADVDGGSVGMDDFELGVQIETLMAEVAGALNRLIDQLALDVHPGGSSRKQLNPVATLAQLRQRRDDLLARYKRLAPDRRRQTKEVLRLQKAVIDAEARLDELVDGTLPYRSDFMAETILERVRADRESGTFADRTYVAVAGAAHLQRMAEWLQKAGERYVLLCPHAVRRLIAACN